MSPFGIQSAQSAEDPSDYYSMHQENNTSLHCTDQECNSGANCVSNYADCPSDKPNLAYVTRVGYRSINELRNDYVTLGSTISLPAPTCTNTAGIPANKSKRFRIYVPTGTTQLDLTLFCSQDPIAVVARWKQAPDAEHVDEITSLSSYTGFSYFDPETSYNLDSMANRDIYLQNPGGTIRVYSGNTGTSSVQEGGWLYVYAFYHTGSTPNIVRIISSVEVYTDEFYAWYDETTNNNGWDAYGDPLLPGATPDSCTTNPSLCESESACTTAGYNWCNEACQSSECGAEPVCDTAENCLTESDCEQSGFYWCDDACQAGVCNSGTCSQEDLDAYYQSGYADAQADSDGDGVIDIKDECSGTTFGSYVDMYGCAMPFEDYNFPAFNVFSEVPTLNIPKLFVGFGFYKVKLTLVEDSDPLKFTLDSYEYVSFDDATAD